MDVEKRKSNDRIRSAKYYKEHREKKLAYFKVHRQTEKGALNQRKANDLYRAKNPDRVKAWAAVSYRKLKKEPCKICSLLPTHAHHPNPKKVLEVVWLCPLHHKKTHLGVIL